MKLAATIDRVREALRYDAATGELLWLIKTRRRNIGQRAGLVRVNKSTGYRRREVSLDGRGYPATHLIWALMTGSWPKATVDHKNCDSLDDRWENLREAAISEQRWNRRRQITSGTGFKCVVKLGEKDARGGRAYRWRVAVGGKRIKSKERYATPEDAYAAYQAKLPELHGQFANDGAR